MKIFKARKNKTKGNKKIDVVFANPPYRVFFSTLHSTNKIAHR